MCVLPGLGGGRTIKLKLDKKRQRNTKVMATLPIASVSSSTMVFSMKTPPFPSNSLKHPYIRNSYNHLPSRRLALFQLGSGTTKIPLFSLSYFSLCFYDSIFLGKKTKAEVVKLLTLLQCEHLSCFQHVFLMNIFYFNDISNPNVFL